jgi:K+-sensing histidine kinase KdpD
LNLAKKALVQLVENAVKYSPPSEPIIITARLIGRYVTTSVVDGGRGIDKSERCLIFAESYRGKRHRDVVYGTGMGLTIANMIVRAHGGSLRVATSVVEAWTRLRTLSRILQIWARSFSGIGQRVGRADLPCA